MRVDAPISFPESQQPNKVGRSGSPTQQNRTAPAGTGQDQAQLSISDSTMQQLRAAVSQVPEIRQDRVEALRQAVSQGKYQISDQQLSDAMGASLLAGPIRLT